MAPCLRVVFSPKKFSECLMFIEKYRFGGSFIFSCCSCALLLTDTKAIVENRDKSRLYILYIIYYIYSIFKYLRVYIFRIDKKYRLAQKKCFHFFRVP